MIRVSVENLTKEAQTVHVFDTLTGGTRPVEGSPFSLTAGGRSPPFAVKADPRGHGLLAFRCANGITKSGLDVTDGAAIAVR